MKYIAGTLAIFLALTALTGCTDTNASETTETKPALTDYMDLVEVASSNIEKVYYDRNTGVMYYIRRSDYMAAMSPIYNTDGSVKIYENWENK